MKLMEIEVRPELMKDLCELLIKHGSDMAVRGDVSTPELFSREFTRRQNRAGELARAILGVIGRYQTKPVDLEIQRRCEQFKQSASLLDRSRRDASTGQRSLTASRPQQTTADGDRVSDRTENTEGTERCQ